MSELRNRSLRGPLVAILTAMLAVWSGSASAASDQEVQQLEARVAELEALVRQLANGQNMQRQELATVESRTATVEQKVTEVVDDEPWIVDGSHHHIVLRCRHGVAVGEAEFHEFCVAHGIHAVGEI